ncbi:MAG: hypothetical protein LBT00_10155 [Spirochaetaceae bacterium]|nr:hypothetical protein [Spirochaetaceae bacterium]
MDALRSTPRPGSPKQDAEGCRGPRNAPRHRGQLPRHYAHHPPVIASREAAKQSRENAPRLDCFTNGKLPQVRNDGGLAMAAGVSLRGRSSEAIQTRTAFTPDCFTNGKLPQVRNGGGLAMAAGVSLRGRSPKQSRRGRPSQWSASLRSQ